MTTWTIETMEHEVASGGVIVAHWQATKTDGDYSARSYGTCSFTPDPSADDYVLYDNLTEEVVLGWCWDGDVDKDAIEASLTAQIEEQKAPTTTDGVPW